MAAPVAKAFGHFQKCLGANTIVIIFLVFLSHVINVSSALAVDPVQQAIEVGKDAVFVCTRTDNGTAENIVWTFSKNNIIIVATTTNDNDKTGKHSFEQRATNINGTLKIHNATESDRGTYVCSVSDEGKSDKENARLVVYVMPDYIEELYGVAAICLVLLFIIILLLLNKRKRNKRRSTGIKTNNNNKRSKLEMKVFTIEKEGTMEYHF